MGVPAGYERVRSTRPYYRSSYVFLSRRDRGLTLGSLDDPRLRRLRIGIQITGDDYDNPPAAQALAARHLASNVRGYTVYGDYSIRDPQRRVVDAVARGEVDTAIVWGPFAGYYAKHEPVALTIRPVRPAVDRRAGPFTFAIAMGVRKDDRALRDALDRAIVRRGGEIRAILRRFGVPIVAAPGGSTGAPAPAPGS
jgi:ABC-type amino acid transport substrate-binding protein